MANSYGLNLAIMSEDAVLEELPKMTLEEIAEVIRHSRTLEDAMSEGFWEALLNSNRLGKEELRKLMRITN